MRLAGRVALMRLPGALALLALVSACQSVRVVPPATQAAGAIPELPGDWAGRTLYVTEHVYIYAVSDATAGEVTRQIAPVAAEFLRRVGRPPPPGIVLIASDAGEETIRLDWKEYFDSVVSSSPSAAEEKTEPAAPDPGVPAAQASEARNEDHLSLRAKLTESDEKLAAGGLDLNSFWSLLPLPLPPEALSRILGLPLPASTEAVAMMFSTRGLIERKTTESCDEFVAREQIGLLGRLLIELQRPSMIQKFTILRDRVLFSLWVDQLPESWTPEAREALMESYKRAHGLRD